MRVTATGDLYPCLGQNDMLPLLPVLRGNTDACIDTALAEAIRQSMGIKPHGHDFDVRKPAPAVVRFMSLTGG